MKKIKLLPLVICAALSLSGCSNLVNELLDRFNTQSSTVATKTDYSFDSVTEAVSADTAIVTASVNEDGTVTLTSISEGTTTVTVTAKATNPESGWPQTVTLVYEVTVDVEGNVTCTEKDRQAVNHFPEKTSPLSGITGLVTITQAVSADESIVTAEVTSEGTVALTSKGEGTTTVTVRGINENNDIVTITYPVTVGSDGNITVGEGTSFTNTTRTVDFITDGSLASVTSAQSSDEETAIVTAEEDGKYTVTAVREGSATVSVTGKNAADEDVYITYSITVAADGALTVGEASVTVKCTISFDPNGGSGTIEAAHQTKNTSYTIDTGSGRFTRQHHSITGWNTAADGSGTSYTLTGTIENVASNITLYAVWQVNSLGPSVTLEAVGGEVQTGFTYADTAALTSSSESITLTAAEGFENYPWKMDGEVLQDDESNQYTLDPSSDEVTAGCHKITLVVKDSDGNYWSASAVVTVQK